MTKTSKAATADIEPGVQYSVVLKSAIRVGGTTLRPDKPHILSGRVLIENISKAESYAAL